jgi:hypothetical protein
MRRVLLAGASSGSVNLSQWKALLDSESIDHRYATGCSVGWIHSPTRLVIGVTSPRLASAGQHASKNGGGGVVN